MNSHIHKILLAALAASTIALGASAEGPAIADGLLAYYPFDGNMADASGNRCNLNVQGTAPSWTTDRNGDENAAASFGGGGYLTPSPIFAASNSMTLVAWVKPGATIPAGIKESTYGYSGESAVNASSSIVFFPPNGGYGNQSGLGVCVGVNAVVVIEHRVNTIASPLVWYGEIGEEWTHIAVTVSDNGAPDLYVNGQHVKTGLKSNYMKTIGNPTGGSGNSIGTIAGGDGWKKFVGSLDELLIYGRALEADAIQILFTGWAGEGDGSEENPYVVKSKSELETVLKLGESLFVKFAAGLSVDGPITVPARVSSLSLDLNGGAIVGTGGEAAIVLAGDTAFTASGSSGTISADEGVESVKRPGSVSVAAGSGIEMTGMNSVTTSVVVPKFVDGGAAEATAFEPSEGGTWTLEAYGELANDALGRDVSDGMVHVYASDTVEGLATARPMEGGVEIKDRKSAVKVTLEVTPPTASETQFFRVEFGD